MRDLLLERSEHRFEAALHAQNRIANGGIYRQNFHRLLPKDAGAGDVPTGIMCVRQEIRVPRKRRSGKRNDVRIHADLASLTQPAVRLAKCLTNIFQSGMRRTQDQIEERSHPAGQRGGEYRLDMPMDLCLVEFSEDSRREVLNAEAEHAKTSPL